MSTPLIHSVELCCLSHKWHSVPSSSLPSLLTLSLVRQATRSTFSAIKIVIHGSLALFCNRTMNGKFLLCVKDQSKWSFAALLLLAHVVLSVPPFGCRWPFYFVAFKRFLDNCPRGVCLQSTWPFLILLLSAASASPPHP
jgi:hypothetical protein